MFPTTFLPLQGRGRGRERQQEQPAPIRDHQRQLREEVPHRPGVRRRHRPGAAGQARNRLGPGGGGGGRGGQEEEEEEREGEEEQGCQTEQQWER